MAQRLASLLLRPVRSSSTLTAAFLSTSSSPSSNSTQPNLDKGSQEILLLEDGREADLQLLLSPDVATSLRYLLAILRPPTSDPKLTLRIATFLLNPPRPSSASSSPASSPKPHTRTKPESVRAAVALLFGITSLLSQPSIREDEEHRLEELAESLVGIFVKGGVRPPPAGCAKSSDLEEEIAVAILGRGNETRARCGSRSAWELSRVVVERLESRIIEMQQSEGSVSSEEERRRRVRIGITTTYLLALLASSTTSSSTGSTKASSRLSTTESLFAKCIDLGLSISLVGASPSTPSLPSPHDSHASSLVWKSRKRLELSGHTSLAILGLPSSSGYEKWDGGAGERARLAEEKVRKVGEEKAAVRSRRSLSRLDESRMDNEGGDLLDAPRRLKGKKISVDQRRGTYTRSSGSSTASSSGPTTPTGTHASLQLVGCPFPHHSHGDPTSLTFLSSSNRSIRTQSTTSLPSLNKKPSIHLLNMVASPPQADTSLPRDHRNDTLLPSSSALKASTPIPLPNLLDSHGIFSPSCASIDSSPSPPPPSNESVYDRGSKLLRRSFSRLAIPFIQDTASTPPPLPTSDSSSSSPSLPTDARGRPSIRISSLGQSSFSSESSITSSPPTTPILISEAQVPKIAFQPSSFRYECFEGNGNHPNATGIWRPLSPRGDRVRILSGAIRGRREN